MGFLTVSSRFIMLPVPIPVLALTLALHLYFTTENTPKQVRSCGLKIPPRPSMSRPSLVADTFIATSLLRSCDQSYHGNAPQPESVPLTFPLLVLRTGYHYF